MRHAFAAGRAPTGVAEHALRQDPEPFVALERLAPAAVGSDQRSKEGRCLCELAAVGCGEGAGERDVLLGQPRLAGRLHLLIGRGSRSDLVATPVARGHTVERSQLGEWLEVVFDP